MKEAANAGGELELGPGPAPAVGTGASPMRRRIYRDHVPAFVAAALERLYGNLYSTVLRFTLYGGLAGVSTYVEDCDGAASTILLFRTEGPRVMVLNQQIALSAAQLLAFTGAVFDSDSGAQRIAFWAVETALPSSPYPCRLIYCMEELAVALPATEQAYLAKLGKSTRRHVRCDLKRLQQGTPSFDFRVHLHGNASEAVIRAIIEFSRIRLATRRKRLDVGEAEVGRIMALVRTYGFVGVLRLQGQVAAGVIGFRVGSRLFMHMVGHDGQYDQLRVGKLCYYLTIAQCIEDGATECRMTGSTHRYKFNFGGARLRLDTLLVYRRRRDAWRDLFYLGRIGGAALVRRTRQWLLMAEHRDDRLSGLIASCLRPLRALRQGRGAGL